MKTLFLLAAGVIFTCFGSRASDWTGGVEAGGSAGVTRGFSCDAPFDYAQGDVAQGDVAQGDVGQNNMARDNGVTQNENIRDTVRMKKIIRQLEKENLFVYDAPANTAPAATFRKFADNAPTYDFLKMAMEDKSPIIRLYAFKAVAEKMDDLPAALMMRFRNDTARVRVQYRDGIKEVPLNEIINSFLK